MLRDRPGWGRVCAGPGCGTGPGSSASQAAGAAQAGLSVPVHPESGHLELSNAQDAVTPWGQARHPQHHPRAPARAGRLHTIVPGNGAYLEIGGKPHWECPGSLGHQHREP